jgi:signal transduction histidine kinase
VKLETVHKQLLETSRQAGMAEVATSVLHNVGNVLNSVNISCAVIATAVRKSHISTVVKIADLFQEHAGNLADFLINDPRGQKLPALLANLATRLMGEQASSLKELRHLADHIDHIKEIVAMQQSYGKIAGVTERVNVTDLVEDSLRMNAGALVRHEVMPIRDYQEVPPITVEKHKVLQILVNLIRNAKYACDESGRGDKKVTLRVSNGGSGVRISIIDNGVGIPAENMIRIFNHGFTTRKDGHGFGLHSAVLAAQELGGKLVAHSEGPGQGAVFTLELPFQTDGETYPEQGGS